jgi:hypothetical protein
MKANKLPIHKKGKYRLLYLDDVEGIEDELHE